MKELETSVDEVCDRFTTLTDNLTPKLQELTYEIKSNDVIELDRLLKIANALQDIGNASARLTKIYKKYKAACEGVRIAH